MAAGKRLPGFCASLAALLVLLFFFSATYLLWVALILTVAVIASALLLKADARRLQLEMTISGGRVGQQVSLRLHSRLAGSILLASAIVAELEVSSVLPDRVEKLCLQLPLQALRDDFETTVTARLSGETRVRCLNVQLTDPLGLFLARCAPCRECRTVFYPQPVALQLTFSEDAFSAGTTEEMVRRHRGNDPSETFDVRDYVPGDDVRSIHWKLSGKMDTLIVRQASDPAHYDTVLLPDLGIAHRDSTCPTDAEFNSAVAVTMALCENEPERNRVYLNVSGGSRAYLYAPSSVEIVSGTQTKDVKDTRMAPQGLLGARIYTVTELSSAYPAELTVRASWVAEPQTQEQERYAQAEAVYREFVFRNYTAVDKELAPVLQELFWADAQEDGDSIYSAVDRVRQVLSQRTETASDGTLSADVLDLLTGTGRGNAVLYASAAVQALRSRGIPARYVEGYYVSADMARSSASQAVTLTAQNAHAWAEVYFDGIGWLPVDVTPGYYFDAVTLQQMVALPDATHKTAAIDDAERDSSQAEGGGTTGKSPLQETVMGLKQLLLVLAGLLSCLLVLATVLFLAAEMLRYLAIRLEDRAIRRAAPRQKTRLLRRKLLRILSACGIDACLGWSTGQTDWAVAITFPLVQPGEYTRVASLLEKFLFGGQELQPHELRTIYALLEKVESGGKNNLSARLKRRYSPLVCLRRSFRKEQPA